MIAIYGRNDLDIRMRNKPIDKIQMCDIVRGRSTTQDADVVLFRDSSGRTRVLKNRYIRINNGEMYIEIVNEDHIKIQ